MEQIRIIGNAKASGHRNSWWLRPSSDDLRVRLRAWTNVPALPAGLTMHNLCPYRLATKRRQDISTGKPMHAGQCNAGAGNVA